jgi:hypothetical protein
VGWCPRRLCTANRCTAATAVCMHTMCVLPPQVCSTAVHSLLQWYCIANATESIRTFGHNTSYVQWAGHCCQLTECMHTLVTKPKGGDVTWTPSCSCKRGGFVDKGCPCCLTYCTLMQGQQCTCTLSPPCSQHLDPNFTNNATEHQQQPNISIKSSGRLVLWLHAYDQPCTFMPHCRCK